MAGMAIAGGGATPGDEQAGPSGVVHMGGAAGEADRPPASGTTTSARTAMPAASATPMSRPNSEVLVQPATDARPLASEEPAIERAQWLENTDRHAAIPAVKHRPPTRPLPRPVRFKPVTLWKRAVMVALLAAAILGALIGIPRASKWGSHLFAEPSATPKQGTVTPSVPAKK